MADNTEDTTRAFGHDVPILRNQREQAERASRENETQRLARVESELRAKDAADVVREIKSLVHEERLRAYAEETIRELKQSIGKKGKAEEFAGRESDPNSPRGRAKNSKEAAQRILLAAQTGKLAQPAGTPEPSRELSEFAEHTIRAIGQKIRPEDVSENSGAVLYDVLGLLVRGDAKNFEQLFNSSRENLMLLSQTDRIIHNRLADSLKQIGRETGGISEETLEQMFKVAEQDPAEDNMTARAREEGMEVEEYYQYQNDLQRGLRRYIGDEEEDQNWVKALYSPNLFIERVNAIQNDPKKYGEVFLKLSQDAKNSEAYWQELSNIVTNEISFRFGKIYRSIARAHKDKFIDEIANENPMESINVAKTNMLSALTRLSDRFTNAEVRKKYLANPDAEGAMRFFSKKSRRFETEKKIKYTDAAGKEQSHSVLQDRRISVDKPEEVDLSDFLSGVKFQVERFIEHVLPYNHNIQALFLRQAGQDGTFWGQIGGYAAQNMSTFDLDSLNHIPDADIISSAYRLYSKYVKADFAKWDWNNKPGRFTEDFSTPNTPVQEDVIKQLKRLHSELNDPHNKWRLDQAMNIAIGISRGVFLTEVTSVAWADAPHTGEGGPTFESYYTNSNAALMGLNPQHTPDRWKTPGTTIGPLMHLPVHGLDRKFMRRWNHIKLYEWMKKRENSYAQGIPAFALSRPRFGHGGHGEHGGSHASHPGRVRKFFGRFTEKGYYAKPDKRLLTFIDAIPNIGKVGGPIERGSWRNKAYEGWIEYNADGSSNLLDTFKGIENIGFEGALWWVDNQVLAKIYDGHSGSFTDEFGAYLYDNYINPVGEDGNSRTGISYDSYVAQIKNDLKDDKQNEAEYAGIVTYRGLAHMLKQRTPTLMPTIERTRLSDTGTRGWQTLREKCGWGNLDLDKMDRGGTDKMDRALKNVMLVEQQVRRETSRIMKESINNQIQDPNHKDDINFKPSLKDVPFEKGKEYIVTEERFEKELKKLMTGDEAGTIQDPKDKEEFDEAVKLFKATQEYLDDDYMNNFAEKLRNNKQPEKYFPFAIAAEELDTSFLTYASAGPDVMRRALAEIGSVESNVVKPMLEGFMGKLRQVAMVEHKHDTLVHAIHEVHQQLDQIHGETYANEVADYMARAATAYFKRDWDSKGIMGKIHNLGKPHSLAAQFSGGSWKNVWEWEVAEQDSFYRELDRMGLLPDRPINPNVVKQVVPRKFLGIPYGSKKVMLEDESGRGGPAEHSGLKIREDMGANRRDMAKEIFYKYAPLVAIGMLYMLIKKAAKEEQESKH